MADSIAAALEGPSRLLIVDNCEHLLDAAADIIEAILARSDTVTVVATSREGLRIDDEQLWSVSSLDTDSGLDSSAASLFFDRAHAVARDISLTPHSAVLEICQRLASKFHETVCRLGRRWCCASLLSGQGWLPAL
jgi:predicted ATPase